MGHKTLLKLHSNMTLHYSTTLYTLLYEIVFYCYACLLHEGSPEFRVKCLGLITALNRAFQSSDWSKGLKNLGLPLCGRHAML